MDFLSVFTDEFHVQGNRAKHSPKHSFVGFMVGLCALNPSVSKSKVVTLMGMGVYICINHLCAVKSELLSTFHKDSEYSNILRKNINNIFILCCGGESVGIVLGS